MLDVHVYVRRRKLDALWVGDISCFSASVTCSHVKQQGPEKKSCNYA